MSTYLETNRGDLQVDVIVGEDADIKSERPLSVGQLQVALRNARGAAPKPGAANPVDRGREDHVGKSDQESNDTDQFGSARRATGGHRISISKILGFQSVAALPAARKSRRTKGELFDSSPEVGVWKIPGSGWSVSFYAHARRWTMLAMALMLLMVGAVTVAGRVLAIVHPAPSVVAAAPRVSDLQFSGAAQAAVLDYLSWDQAEPRTTRMNALARLGFAGAVSDGWDGTGELYAEDTVAIAVLRTGDDRAVVTVQARTAHRPTPTPDQDGMGREANARSAPTTWLTLAVPVAVSSSLTLLTAPPAVVGAAPTQAQQPAVATAADEDTATGRATADTVEKLIAAYASGDLEFARGPGSTFTGLGGMVISGQVQGWRMAKVRAGEDPSLRSGDVTVLWTLPGGAGQLRCSYRIQLAQRENRWLLQQITPALGEPS